MNTIYQMGLLCYNIIVNKITFKILLASHYMQLLFQTLLVMNDIFIWYLNLFLFVYKEHMLRLC